VRGVADQVKRDAQEAATAAKNIGKEATAPLTAPTPQPAVRASWDDVT
jgi:hypothetical protein